MRTIVEPKIPKSIRELVIKQWLQDASRDQIARGNDIGSGTVISIVKERKADISDIDLLREVSLVLKKEELDLWYLHHLTEQKRK